MLDKNYDFNALESQIYQHWDSQGYFTPKIDPAKTPFSIIMPPPNANGSLHIGHAMFVTLQDIMARYHRMKGDPTLLLPGADHAGILTQVVFERLLKKQGKSRYALGREEFVKQCLAFTQENKQMMYSQIKKLGASVDWSRATFTLDLKPSEQVIATFVKLYRDRLLYRADRMINWCPRCMTALSDLEVEHEEIEGKLYHMMYPLIKKGENTGQTRYLIVATSRPETMLGDTAVAVHPDDDRYQQFIGQSILLPLMDREIPVVADEVVDREFGTGAVKVTPAHDPVDFEIGQRHKLPSIQVIGFNNKMTEAAGEFVGMPALAARQLILEKLEKMDAVVAVKKYKHVVGHCERCKTILEPQISKQWFINVKPLVGKAIEVVKTKEITLIPKRFEKNYIQWMEHLHDWCISRQLWWGHQLPVYYCGLKGLSKLQKLMNPDLVKAHEGNEGCGHRMIAATMPTKCERCDNTQLIQDPDTLDTWFSSGQWAYTTLMGNSKLETKNSVLVDENPQSDFNYFYPTSVMETGYEILNIWVAKMIMLGLYRTGKIPFKTVYLHGLVRDAFGQKMSKSKGNVINPLDVIEKYGTDALRMALIVGATPGNDISLGEPKIKGYRDFGNKLWNIARFMQMNAEGKKIKSIKDVAKKLTSEDQAFLTRVQDLIKTTTTDLDKFRFSLTGERLYNFVWHELADKYLEVNKERLRNGDDAVLAVLDYTIKTSLKLLHPYVPFVTEAIWQNLKAKDEPDLMMAPWPTV